MSARSGDQVRVRVARVDGRVADAGGHPRKPGRARRSLSGGFAAVSWCGPASAPPGPSRCRRPGRWHRTGRRPAPPRGRPPRRLLSGWPRPRLLPRSYRSGRRESPWRWSFLGWPRTGSAVVGELHREVVVGFLDQRLDRLQVVAALAAHPQLLALDLGLDVLRALVPDQLGDLLGVLGGDPFLGAGGDLVELAGGARLTSVQRLEADTAADQLGLVHVQHNLDPPLGVGLHLDRLAGPADRRVGVLEVEPLPHLLGRLVDRKSTRLNSSHTEIYTLSLHDALPISAPRSWPPSRSSRRTSGSTRRCS